MARRPLARISRLQLRKTPRQRRAQMTLDSLLQAGAIVLRDHGYEQFSVERVAVDCGVAVGTFYAYFPHKDALIAELRRRHNRHIATVLAEALRAVRDLEPRLAVRQVVQANVDLHLEDPALHHALTVTLADVGVEHADADATEAFLRSSNNAFANYLVEHLRISRPRAIVMASVAFVVAESLTHAAVIDGNLGLAPSALVDEITAVLLGYIDSASCGN